MYKRQIPNLLVPEIAEAILLRTANAIASKNIPSIYICNIMTQPGETTGYSVADHIRAIDLACGQRLFDTVLVQGKSPSGQALIKYAQENSHPVFLDREAVKILGRKILLTNVMYEDEQTGFVRHDSMMLSEVLFQWYNQI